jgi:hypothetical protein
MNHEALFQTSDALHQYDGDHNDNDGEHVRANRHVPMHLVEHRLNVGRGGYVAVDDVRDSCGNGVGGRRRGRPNLGEYCGRETHLILQSQEKMSHPTDLERRIHDILHRQRGGVAIHAPKPTQALVVFSLGLFVGFMVATVCAPLHSTKTAAHNQPWRIRYATSDRR